MAARYPEDAEKYLQENQANHQVESEQNLEENGENGEEAYDQHQEEQSIKHPLENRWTLWYYENNPKRDWKDNLHVVGSFDTAEDFWRHYNYMRPVSELQHGCDYSLFKEGKCASLYSC